MKNYCLTALLIAGVSHLLLVTNQAQAQTQRTFVDPGLEPGRLFIAGCLTSYRFQDPCTEDARTVIAHNFCRYQGYRGYLQYQVKDLGWKNRHSMYAWREVYNNGRPQTGFYPDVSSFRFTVIECSR